MNPLRNSRLAAAAWLGLGASLTLPSIAAETDIATAPLFTSTTTVVKPNVMFVMDNSGSMAWDYMPDEAEFNTDNVNSKYGRRAAQCNGLAFIDNDRVDEDKKIDYALPVDASGTTLLPASTDFLGGTVLAGGSVNYLGSGDVNNTTSHRRVSSTTSLAVVGSGDVEVTLASGSTDSYYEGMVVSLMGSTSRDGRVSLSSGSYMIGKVKSWNAGTRTLTVTVAMKVGDGPLSAPYVGVGSPIDNVYYSYSGAQTALDYQYPENRLDKDSAFYKECNSAIASDPGKSVFTAHIVTPGSAIAQRYANWYYYYSTRMRLMKTSLTLAFKGLDDKFRVGYSEINADSALPLLDTADFGSTQKSSFYSNFNAAVASGNTPLRSALSRVGRYYAKKLPSQSYDPVQYSCQKNFTILSTDGYWNSTAGVALDGSSAIGQQDGGATVRPMYDGGLSTATTTKRWTETATGQRTSVTPISSVLTRVEKSTSTVTTPRTKTTYELELSRSLENSGISRSCSGRNGSSYPCTVTVTTSSVHGLSTGDTVTLSDISPGAYNGTFTITRTGNRSYTYTLTGTGTIPNTPSGSNRGDTLYQPGGCPIGQGKLVTTVQTYNSIAATTTTTITRLTSLYESVLVRNLTKETPMTEEVVTVNGVANPAQTTAGTPTFREGTVVSGPERRLLSGPAGEPGTPTATVANSSSTPVTSAGYPQTGASCVTSRPAATDVAGTASTVTSGPTTTETGPAESSGTVVRTDVFSSSSSGTVTTTTTTANTGGSSNTLADVAMYYYQTDLRTSGLSNCTGALGTSVCANEVKAMGADTAEWQHMSTYTLSLGLSGTLKYDPNYESQATGDYRKIVLGDLNWPVPSSDGGAVNIDDLWHAAVNGRGRFFSANNPTTLASSLAAALSSIDAKVGSSSAAATSTLQPVEGDNGVYIAQFKSAEWTGDLRAYRIDPNTGAVTTSRINAAGEREDTADWSASEQLSPTTERTILYFKSGAGNTGSLRPFTYDNLTADGLRGHFDNACSKAAPLSQCAGLTSSAAEPINSGANMVSFLRGQAQPQYRIRSTVLGDIVNSSPVYVGKPGFQYTENGYAAYKTAQAARAPTLYVGANDGMLHAFNAADGTERWAYIPGIVMPRLYQLGDRAYESKHQYFVDATPVAGDVYSSGWKTILVGGLNAGGAGYYALDVTNPTAPVALWEFKHDNLGLSYGNPVITKRKDGTWVVVVTSGYNNADGGGHLFVLDAMTGALLKQVSTGVGSSGSPSGLGRLNAWVDFDTENLAQRFYAGDLLGNVWRFDIDDVLAPHSSAFKLAQLLVDGVPQPITTQVQLAEIDANGSKHAVVYVGTGQYLGRSDVTSTAKQSIYAIKDALAETGLGDVRGGGTLVPQTVVTTGAGGAAVSETVKGTVRTVSPDNPVDWSVKNGWYVDLETAGERINVDMQLAFNVLTAAGNVPGTTATDCVDAGSGTSWLYQLNVVTGKGTGELVNSMVAGLATVQLGKGTGITIVTKTDVSEPLPKTIEPSAASSGAPRRSSWRELVD